MMMNVGDTKQIAQSKKFQTKMLKKSLCDYSDVRACKRNYNRCCTRRNAATIAADRNNKQVLFKTCSPFTDCINEKRNTQVNNAKDLDVVMLMYILIEYSDNYTRTSESL